jgi:quercetin dioxygenase-like cupin family protein
MTSWLGTLALTEHPDGVVVEGADAISYDLARNEAHVGPVELAGHALVWTLTPGEQPGDRALLWHSVVLDDETAWIARCDRVDFPPGGIAYTHTHPGPGIRYQLAGTLRVETDGDEHEYAAGGAWYESGPEAVLATAATDRPSAFVRVLLLPEAWAGKRTIRYVHEEDEARPKLQRPTVFLEHPFGLTR